MLKLLNLFILRSYLGPFLRSLGVSLFILVIQFLSRYKGDIFGKGLDTWVLIKIFGFASASLMVLALPVSVLLSSLFTMGNFGEHYELAAMRAGGLSLQRILKPMLVATMAITLVSFAMSSYLVPLANLKLYSLLYDIQQMKPAFSLQPGHFNSAVDNYVIRISDKDIHRDVLYDIIIYDHTTGMGNDRMVRADSGTLLMDPYGRYMHMSLYHGVSYEVRYPDMTTESTEGMVRVYFDSLRYNFDLKGFSLERTAEQQFNSHQYMLNPGQLQAAIDSIDALKLKEIDRFAYELSTVTIIDSSFMDTTKAMSGDPPENILSKFPKYKHMQIVQQALDNVHKGLEIVASTEEDLMAHETERRLRVIELHYKFSLPMACMVFLFVGAPLGAIIRKGGVGIPIIVSVSLYLAFYVLMIQGKKMATEGILPVWAGAWMPNIVLSPLALYLTFESASTQRLLSGEVLLAIGRFLARLFLWYLNPLYWLWQIPPVQKGIIIVLRPVVRRLFPERQKQQPRFRVRR